MASLKGSNISLSLCVNDMLMLLSIISWGNDTCNEMILLVEVKLVIPSPERLSGGSVLGWRTKDGCPTMGELYCTPGKVGQSYEKVQRGENTREGAKEVFLIFVS